MNAFRSLCCCSPTDRPQSIDYGIFLFYVFIKSITVSFWMGIQANLFRKDWCFIKALNIKMQNNFNKYWSIYVYTILFKWTVNQRINIKILKIRFWRIIFSSHRNQCFCLIYLNKISQICIFLLDLEDMVKVYFG